MSRRNSERGSALIEFAGSLILIAAAFTGAFQIGYAFYTYNLLVNAVRSGARYAAMQPPNPTGANAELAIAVQNIVVYGDPKPAPGMTPAISGLNPSHVQLITAGKTVTVMLRGYSIDSLFTRINLDGRPMVTFPYTNGAGR